MASFCTRVQKNPSVCGQRLELIQKWADQSPDSEDDSDRDEDEQFRDEFADYVYGTVWQRAITLTMAGGGSHWWKYIVMSCDQDGDQGQVYKQDQYGTHECTGTLYVHEDGNHVLLMTHWEFDQLEDWVSDKWRVLQADDV